MADRIAYDGVVVVGAGLAGLSAALAAAPRPVLVLAPSPARQGPASEWAQGGIAAALGSEDSAESHASDTVAAGAGLVDPAMALLLAGEGPGAVQWLARLGVPFDRQSGDGFALSLEAAHARARVARVKGDQAGAQIMRAVTAAADRAGHVEVRHGFKAFSLLQDSAGAVRGVLADAGGRPLEIVSPAVILATGGIGGLYSVTTNPPSALGEGLALAAMAGAQITDPEFVQFHPTAMDLGVDPAPLATEALRGEGAILIDGNGRRFMAELHEQAELAPRDVVARAVFGQIVAGHGAFLDMRKLGERLGRDFPGVFAACISAGKDPREEPIPVAPAAHYHMGGVATDAHGRTQVAGLYAAGECAWTGVHGANRLASNSLLEAVVFGRRAGEAARDFAAPTREPIAAPAPGELAPEFLSRLRKGMSMHAGVVREAAGLRTLLHLIDQLEQQAGASSPLLAARLIAHGALERRESRGGHFRSDFPRTADQPSHTRLRFAGARFESIQGDR